jgi:ABC-type sugar transport system substrate-binding protein
MSSKKILLKATPMVIAAVVAVILVSCSKSSNDKQKREIGFLMTLDHPYWLNMRLGAQDEAQKLGVEVTVLNAREDPVLQIEQINEMIAKQVDIVCLVPMKKEPLVRGVQMLNRAQIPVIIVQPRDWGRLRIYLLHRHRHIYRCGGCCENTGRSDG